MSKQSKPQHFCLNSEIELMHCLFYNMCNYLAFSCYAISVGPSFFASQNLSPQRTEIKENASAFVVHCHDVRTSQGTIEDKEHDIKHFRYLSALHHPQTLPKLGDSSTKIPFSFWETEEIVLCSRLFFSTAEENSCNLASDNFSELPGYRISSSYCILNEHKWVN